MKWIIDMELPDISVLENLLSSRYDQTRIRSEDYLHMVRRLPCLFPECRQTPAGTAHHIWTAGTGWKCSDYLTIPLCIAHHVTGQRPVQQMNSAEFAQVFGYSEEEAVRRTFLRVRAYIDDNSKTDMDGF